MDAIRYALVAMGLISIAPSLARWIAIRERFPTENMMVLSTFVTFIFFLCEKWWKHGTDSGSIFLSRGTLLSCLLGLIFGVALHFYYSALSLTKGDITIVVPIWGLQIVGASVIALLVFQEGITLNKVLGFVFAILSIFFVTR